MYANPQMAGANAYANVGVETGVTGASPHRLIQMMFEGFLDRVAAAKGAIERGDQTVKAAQVNKAMSIIAGLRECLNEEKGGELADNLNELYRYVERRLFEASRDNSVEGLDEATELVSQIKEAWDQIPAEYHHMRG